MQKQYFSNDLIQINGIQKKDSQFSKNDFNKTNSEVNSDLRIIGIGVTNECNLTCDYCSRSSSPWDHESLSLELIDEVLQDATEIAKHRLTVAITGGEPILHPNFREIVKLVTSFDVITSLNSNGVLLTPEIASFCMNEGVANFSVGIDGVPEVYQKTDGNTNRIDRVAKNLTEIKKMGGRFYLGCTITPKNLEYVGDVVEFASDLGATGISLSRTYPIGRALKNYEQLFIGWNDFCNAIEEANKVAPKNFTVDIEDNALRHLWDLRYENELNQNNVETDGWNGCFAGILMAHIEANGSVLACAFLGKPAGNIHDQTFREIWKNSTVMKDMRRRDLLKGACGSCEQKYSCGGCRGRAYGIYGDYFAEDPLCPKTKEEAERLPKFGCGVPQQVFGNFKKLPMISEITSC